jgi:hypothetical protein
MTDQPAPETDAKLASAPHPPSDSPDYARALEIHDHLLRAERDEHIARNNDALLALHVTTAELDEARAERDALRADVARLRAALEGMLIAEMEVRQMEAFGADEVEAEPHWMAARAALATPAK